MAGNDTVSFRETALGQSILEMAEDRYKEIVRHHQDLGIDSNSSSFTLKVGIVVDERGQRFDYTVSSLASLAVRKPFRSVLFSSVEADGSVDIVEFDPGQLRIPFSK